MYGVFIVFMLFVDFKGFMFLIEGLMWEGIVGVEEFLNILNEIFELFICLVYL